VVPRRGHAGGDEEPPADDEEPGRRPEEVLADPVGRVTEQERPEDDERQAEREDGPVEQHAHRERGARQRVERPAVRQQQDGGDHHREVGVRLGDVAEAVEVGHVGHHGLTEARGRPHRPTDESPAEDEHEERRHRDGEERHDPHQEVRVLGDGLRREREEVDPRGLVVRDAGEREDTVGPLVADDEERRLVEV
jgi:hypothetical protein